VMERRRDQLWTAAATTGPSRHRNTASSSRIAPSVSRWSEPWMKAHRPRADRLCGKKNTTLVYLPPPYLHSLRLSLGSWRWGPAPAAGEAASWWPGAAGGRLRAGQPAERPAAPPHTSPRPSLHTGERLSSATASLRGSLTFPHATDQDLHQCLLAVADTEN
jgi:hypothetical protein